MITCMSWQDYLPWFGTDDETNDETEIELREVKWTVEEQYTYPKLTERVVWSGGAEKVITHVDFDWCYGWQDWVDENGESVLDVRESPAFTETLEVDEYTETKEVARTAWVEGSPPPGAEPTGNTKTVLEC